MEFREKGKKIAITNVDLFCICIFQSYSSTVLPPFLFMLSCKKKKLKTVKNNDDVQLISANWIASGWRDIFWTIFYSSSWQQNANSSQQHEKEQLRNMLEKKNALFFEKVMHCSSSSFACHAAVCSVFGSISQLTGKTSVDIFCCCCYCVVLDCWTIFFAVAVGK